LTQPAVALIVRGAVLARFVRQRVRVLNAVPSRVNLGTLRELAESGQVVPAMDRTFPLCDAAAAIGYLEREHARAKVVLIV
jgi:NADPH:quinone reductase-like Zn-dependent oxidoreductase